MSDDRIAQLESRVAQLEDRILGADVVVPEQFRPVRLHWCNQPDAVGLQCEKCGDVFVGRAKALLLPKHVCGG